MEKLAAEKEEENRKNDEENRKKDEKKKIAEIREEKIRKLCEEVRQHFLKNPKYLDELTMPTGNLPLWAPKNKEEENSCYYLI